MLDLIQVDQPLIIIPSKLHFNPSLCTDQNIESLCASYHTNVPFSTVSFDIERVLQCMLMLQLLPFIRGTPTNPALTLERLARCVFALPARWFSQSQDKCASPIVDQAHAISRVLQNSKVAGISRSSLEQKLSKLLSYLQSA